MALAPENLAEYLSEIREQVCSRCIERPPGGPPCAPLGKNCGVELHLPQLIDSIRDVHSDLLAPYLDHNRAEICEKCAFLHSSICPCPMDYLSGLIVEAVETVDRRHDRTDEVPGPVGAGCSDLERAYREASGSWRGCDWHTHFGKTGLDLCGWDAARAVVMAHTTTGVENADWIAAANWLAQVEAHAQQAEARAAAAVDAARRGEWHEALQFAQHAWSLEFGTGRAIWHPFPLAWQKLLKTAEAAVLAQRVSI